MQLRDYMHFNKVTCHAMAEKLGINAVYLNAIKNLKRRPGYELAMKIEKLTGKQVTITELRGK